MKALLEPLSASRMSSFLVREFAEKNFSAPYHFHPEYELTYIRSGKGKRYVGTNMQNFYPGDFVLLGPNLPHCWKNEKTKRGEKAGSVVIQFQNDFLGDDFLSKPELSGISQLLARSGSGIRFTADDKRYEQKMMQLLQEQNPFRRMILFLELLEQLSLTKSYHTLDKQKSKTGLTDTEHQRINAVMAYIIDNFKTGVTLNNAAAVICMTPQSFCKYFRKNTRKTFMEAVTDYRVDYAAQQLVHTDHSISQIGFDSGFNDISNFHKTFKAKMELSPLQYRNAFTRKLELL